MPPKRPATSPAKSPSVSKKTRKSLTLEAKLDIIHRHERGEKTNSIARHHGLAPSTVSTIFKAADSIKKAGETVSSLQVKRTTRTRDPALDKMETLLEMWISDQVRRRMPVSTSLITAKALSLWEDIQSKLTEEEKAKTPFGASKGWFDRFRKRAGLHNIQTTGESASADRPAADAFVSALQHHVSRGGYSSKQVINLDETGLYWKKMSSKTFISKEEKTAPGFKAAKDRVTLTLGGNAEGDLKLKPLLIYQSENPRALKGFSKAQLPVIWKSNKKAWLTSSLCHEYVTGYLSPALEEYAAASNIANRFLLIIDNAPSHPRAMEDWAENIEVLFMPPNTTSLIQPMDQTVIATFKAYYQRRTMAQLVQAMDNNPDLTIQEYWRMYNIKKGIDNIAEAWNEVDSTTMNAAWSKVWPDVVSNFTGFVPTSVNSLREDIVRLSHSAGFDEVDADDVQELLDSHSKPLTNEELEEMLKQRVHHEITEPVKERVLTLTVFFGVEDALFSLEKTLKN